MTRPIQATIDCKALSKNLSLLKKETDAPFFWGVVKADAYGHGLNPLLPVFHEYCDGLAILDISEGLKARELGWDKALLMIEGFFSAGEILNATAAKIDTVVHSFWQIEDLRQAPLKEKIGVYIKLNTGMNRLGFNPEQFKLACKNLESIPAVEIKGLVSHFANSDITFEKENIVLASDQFAALKEFESPYPVCFCNSAGILWHQYAKCQGVRAGIAMYGVSPNSDIPEKEIGLEPVMKLETKIIALRAVRPGDAIGYGSHFKVAQPMKIAVIACGYADGYPRTVSSQAWVGILGKKCRVVGAVSMDMITVDVSEVPEADIGTPVELWGTFPTVNEVGAWAGTIGYELLTGVNKRVRRIYKR